MLKKTVAYLAKHEWLTLGIIILLGLALRLYNLKDTFIFGYDQARDAQRIYDLIYLHDLKLVGPETDIPGIFHGPLFYYLIAPVYFLFHFDPNYVALFLVLLNVLGIVLIYQTGKLLFNKHVGLLAGVFWALSFEQANYSRFISNPSPMPLTITLFFFGIALFLFKKKELGLIISAVAYGLSIHLNFFLIYLGMFYPLFYLIYRPKLQLKTLLTSLGVFMIIVSTFVLAEIKFHLTGIKSLVSYMGTQGDSAPIMENIARYTEKLSFNITYSFFSFNTFIGFLILIFFFILAWKMESKKDRLIFLFVWIFSTLPLFAFKSGVHNTAWLNSGLFGSLSILIAIGLIELTGIYSYWTLVVSIIVILLSNLNLFVKTNFSNISLFAIQNILYKDIKVVADYTYTTSNGQPYSICAVSNPLFINTTWSYLYSSYGKYKYGFMPFWSGQPQVQNKNLLPYDTEHVKQRYLIIEPTTGVPEHSIRTSIYAEDQISVLDEDKFIGQFRIQKRHIPEDKKELRDTLGLGKKDLKFMKENIKVDPRYTCYIEYN